MSDNIFQILDETVELFELNPVAIAAPKHKVLTEILSLYSGSIVDSRLKLKVLIEIVIRYCGKSVLIDGVEVFLSWSHVQSYLEKYTPLNEHLYSHIVAVFAEKYKRSFNGENTTWKLDFAEDTQSALSFKLFLQHILPHEKEDLLKESDGVLYLPEDLTFFYSRYFTDEEGKLFPHYLHDTLLKTLRADKFDFSTQFILGIIPGENNQRRLTNLRPKNRKPYIVTPDGKAMLRLDKKPMLTPEQKQGYTQAQSCTLIGDIQSPPFGFRKDRNDTLYGLITDIQDAHIQRLLMDDGGTVGRKFEYEDLEAAQMKLRIYYSHDRLFFSPKEIRTFKNNNTLRDKWKNVTNELLARLRFNPYRSVVCICADSLEARLLAYDFAEELWEHYCAYAKKQGVVINNNYRIPVVFYFPKQFDPEKRHLRFYTEAMYREDQKEAYEMYQYHTGDRRQALYVFRCYEFLLGLKEITLDILKEDVEKVPLALHMIKNGYIRHLMRLLRPPRCSPSLKIDIIEYLLSQKLIKKNDPVIGEFILVEEFELADHLIRETGSEKKDLQKEDGLLVSKIIEKGNARQIHYFGEDFMLRIAANFLCCSSIKLYLKEFRVENQDTLDNLLFAAARSGEHTLARNLLQMGAKPRSGRLSPIRVASEFQDWEMAKLLALDSREKGDEAEFGIVVLNALKFNNLVITMMFLGYAANPSWRHYYSSSYTTESTVFYAILHGHNSFEFLIQLINYELQFRDENTLKRICFEIVATYEVDDSISREFLLKQYKSRMNISFESDEWGKLFKESLQTRFEEVVNFRKSPSFNRLYKLNPKISAETAKKMIESLLVAKDKLILDSMMSNPECSDGTRGHIIQEMMRGDEFSEKEILEYITKHNITVRSEHIRRASRHHTEKFVSFMLENYRPKEIMPQDEYWDLYQAFQYYQSSKSKLLINFLRALGTWIIRDFVLLSVVSFFHKSYIWPRSDWKTLLEYQNTFDHFEYVQPMPISLSKEYHPEIMAELCEYFSHRPIPCKEVGERTFKKIFDLFEKTVKPTPRFQFRDEKSHNTTFNREAYDFMVVWKKRIFQYEKECQEKIVDSSLIDSRPNPEFPVLF
ncbi:MAG: hypothetical protein K2X50_07145 [Gammaproteobacteria bacterium]|nr:hypothetical protein [Gammaproteobacteria bacterium]